MSVNRKATMAKRQRELDQKDRVKERDARRAERKQRAEERAASGQVGPEMGEPFVPGADADAPAPVDPAAVAAAPDTPDA